MNLPGQEFLQRIASQRLNPAASSLVAYAKAVYPSFEDPPHIRKIADALERVERGECKRLIIAVGPRHGKSFTTSQAFPGWYLGRNPKKTMMAVSFGQELADTFGRRVRNLLLSDEHKKIFPDCRLSPSSSAIDRFETTEGGSYFAVGRGGAQVGRGCHILLIDDPLRDRQEADSPTVRKAMKEWFSEVAFTRLEPGGAIVIIAQRWHQDDLTGWLLSEHADEKWEVLCFPSIAEEDDILGRKPGEALWPARFDIKALLAIKRVLGTAAFSALHQQRPTALEGGTFKRHWLQYYDAPPVSTEIQEIVMSFDTAFKAKTENDYSVCAIWAATQTGYYLLYVWREKCEFPVLLAKAKELARIWKPHRMIIEDKASGTSLGQQLIAETALPVALISVFTDKFLRANVATPLFEAGKVFLPREAGWVDEYVDELCSFPAVKHDDQVDATSQAMEHFRLHPAWDGSLPDDSDDDLDHKAFSGTPRGLWRRERPEQRPWSEVLGEPN